MSELLRPRETDPASQQGDAVEIQSGELTFGKVETFDPYASPGGFVTEEVPEGPAHPDYAEEEEREEAEERL